jgi:hypothetical protein
MYKLNKRYKMTAPKGTITPTGVREIFSLIYAQNVQDGDWAKRNPDWEGTRYLPTLPDNWAWVWVVQKGETYRGKFPKRVAQYYKKVHNLKAPDAFIEQIGNIARAHSEELSVYYFDFTRDFDWEEGDFGDDGSCFWGGNAAALDMLYANGAQAIRFYNNYGHGIARAWLVPMEAEGITFIFNGYGFPGNPTLTVAQAFARFTELRYQQVALTNNGSDDDTLWINSGIGYVIGKAKRIEEIHHYDFGWYDPEENYPPVVAAINDKTAPGK